MKKDTDYNLNEIDSENGVKKSDSELGYDTHNTESIINYAKNLIGETIYSVNGSTQLSYNPFAGKGSFGQALEKYYFKYEPNSNPEPDFEKVGMELKVSPLTAKKKKELPKIEILKPAQLKVKERLVLCMFNLDSYLKPLDESHVWKKLANILIIFYRYQKDVRAEQLKIENVFHYILKHRQNDLIIIEDDYAHITNLVQKGRAHEFSEGSTNYLGVCRKGSKNSKEQSQPNSNIKTHRRAFCLKISYMSMLWDEMLRIKKSKDLFTSEELSSSSLDQILVAKLNQYTGLLMSELNQKLNFDKYKNKARFAQMINTLILKNNPTESNEIKKANICLKVIRVNNQTLKPFESISFHNIRYNEIIHEEEWEDSDFYSLITARFLCVIIGQDVQKQKDGMILGSFLWSIPYQDEFLAQEFWNDCKSKIENGDLNHFWKISNHKKFHVRTKAKNAKDLSYDTPTGQGWKKLAYWMNAEYWQEIISNYIKPKITD